MSTLSDKDKKRIRSYGLSTDVSEAVAQVWQERRTSVHADVAISITVLGFALILFLSRDFPELASAALAIEFAIRILSFPLVLLGLAMFFGLARHPNMDPEDDSARRLFLSRLSLSNLFAKNLFKKRIGAVASGAIVAALVSQGHVSTGVLFLFASVAFSAGFGALQYRSERFLRILSEHFLELRSYRNRPFRKPFGGGTVIEGECVRVE